jgi:hypothetical protein
MNTTITIKQRIVILFTILIVVFCVVAMLFVNWGPAQAEKQFIPFGLHSILIADYSEDPRGKVIPPIRETIILQVIKDFLGPGQELEAEAIAAVIFNQLRTPVASVTPNADESRKLSLTPPSPPQTSDAQLTAPTATDPSPSQTPDINTAIPVIAPPVVAPPAVAPLVAPMAVIDPSTSTEPEPPEAPADPAVAPSFTLAHSAGSTVVNEPGGIITFTVSVNNTGTNTISLTGLQSDQVGNLHGQGTCAVGGVIGPGATYSCTYSDTISQNGNTSYTNTVTVSVQDNTTALSSATNRSVVVTITDVAPDITVGKTGSPNTVNEPGSNVTFTIDVQNVSSADTVTLASLVDDKFGNLNGVGTCAVGGIIGIGGTYSCAFTGSVNGLGGTTHVNTVTAKVLDDDGTTVSVSASDSVNIIDLLPSITVTKTSNVAAVTEPGGDVIFTAEVENTSQEMVTLTSFTDNQFGDLSADCAVGGTIAALATYTCTFTRYVSGTAGDTHTNTVSVSAVDDEGNTASGNDFVSVDILASGTCTPPDATKGFVASTDPAHNQTGVPMTTSTIIIYFNQPMDDTIGPGSVVKGANYTNNIDNLAGGNIPLTGLTYDSSNDSVTITFDTSDVDWKTSNSYRLTIKDKVQNVCGTEQAVDVVVEFQTAP